MPMGKGVMHARMKMKYCKNLYFHESKISGFLPSGSKQLLKT
jgi:hypothetical protein